MSEALHRLDLPDLIREVLALDPAAPAVEFHETWSSWGELARLAAAVEEELRACGPGTPVGVLLRNDPAVVATLLGVLMAGCCVVTVNPGQGDAGLARDLRALRLPVVLGVDADWDRDGVPAAAQGAAGLRVRLTDPVLTRVTGLEVPDDGPFRPDAPGVAVEMLTSGTTGPPKRIPLSYRDFGRTVTAAGAHYGSADGASGVRLATGVAVVSSPLVHMSGLFRTLLNIAQGRRIVLLERFRVDDFVAAVRRHRPRAVSLVPAALGMVLDAGVPPAALDGVTVVTSGTAHLPVELQERFEKRYGVAVLPSYGATEFAGGVAGWTYALHQEWSQRKRGSVGRPQRGREVRTVSTTDFAVLPDGEQGQIEVRSGGSGEWVRTTDLGRVDADGFVWIDGRVDDVIVRGGFKITPAEITTALREHPQVRDAGVTGMRDDRLGAVPVAAVELVGDATVDADGLLAYLRERLAGYKVPARLLVVPELPRTPSMKVSQPGLRDLLEGASR